MMLAVSDVDYGRYRELFTSAIRTVKGVSVIDLENIRPSGIPDRNPDWIEVRDFRNRKSPRRGGWK
jgi:hypothetical protein